jgi:anaerobic magnesium-protoporphyrin IX monomethyl ester cyclase
MPKPFRVGLISPYSDISATGLRLLSACIKRAGLDSRLIFLIDPGEWLTIPAAHPPCYSKTVLEQVCELCADFDLIGISLMSNFVGRARSLTQAIHSRLGLPIIWGGIHPTVMPEECLQWADFVCVGEGEEALVELATRLAAGGDTTTIANIWSKTVRGEIIPNSVRPLLHKLDTLPFPDYELETQFVLHDGHLTPLTPALMAIYLRNYLDGKPRPAYMVVASRGCPNRCAYCCENALEKIYPDWHNIRRRSPESIVAEIAAIRPILPGMEAVTFGDSTFTAASGAEIHHFCELYHHGIGLPFFILATPESLTEDKLRNLVDAGLRDIEIGLQSGSPRICQSYHRLGNPNRVLTVARWLDSYRSRVPHPRYDVITDNPYESTADRLETLDLLFALPLAADFNFFSLTFYPGTDLRQQALIDGLVYDEEQQVYNKSYMHLSPTYHNFVLWCFHRHSPRWLLKFLILPAVYCLFASLRLGWLFRWLWRGINFVRNLQIKGIQRYFLSK